MLKEKLKTIGTVVVGVIASQIPVVLGIYLGFTAAIHHNENRKAIVEITSVAISQDLTDALEVTGCIDLPHWDVEGSTGVQICTYGESLHRGWIYGPKQREARKLERAEENK